MLGDFIDKTLCTKIYSIISEESFLAVIMPMYLAAMLATNKVVLLDLDVYAPSLNG